MSYLEQKITALAKGERDKEIVDDKAFGCHGKVNAKEQDGEYDDQILVCRIRICIAYNYKETERSVMTERKERGRARE